MSAATSQLKLRVSIMDMKLGVHGARLNAQFESPKGLVTEAYLDSGGVWTGPGGVITNLDGKRVVEGQTWTPEQAAELYAATMEEFVAATNEAIEVPVSQCQFDAFVVFAWNIGIDGMRNSSALRYLNASEHENAAEAMLLYKYDVLHGGRTGPDGGPARGPDGSVLLKGEKWEKIFRGLYRRHLCGALLFSGRDWSIAGADENVELVKKTEERPYGYRDQKVYATELSDALAVAPLLNQPAIAPEPEPEDIPEPEIVSSPILEEALPVPVGTAPPSPNTKPLDEVPYKLDPNAGAKPMEESERFWGTMLEAVGHFGRTWSTRAVGMGGAVAAFAGDLLKSPAVITILAGCIAWGIFFVVTQYGRKKKVRGEINSTQALY